LLVLLILLYANIIHLPTHTPHPTPIQFGAKLIRDLDCFDTVAAVDSAEVRRSEIPKRSGGLVAVSQSGETKDVMTAVRLGDEVGVRGRATCSTA
jgi:glucosamine 6-phosphate synthetase-like amidotransferase/phosphosugar isomerase protein